MIEMEQKKAPSWVYVLLAMVLISFAIYLVVIESKNKKALLNYKFTEGKVVKFHYNNYAYSLDYTYSVDSKKYKNSIRCSVFNCEDGTKGCVGKTFPVKYAIEDPTISEIDLGKFNDKKHKKIAF